MCNIEPYIEKLRVEFSQFSSVDDNCFDLMCEMIEFETIEEFQFYSRVNDYPQKLSFVCEGVLRIFHLDDAGNEWNKHFFCENDFFSSGSNSKIRSTTAIQALTPIKLLSFPIESFLSLSKKNMQIDMFVNKLLSSALEREKYRGLMLMSLNASDKYEHFTKIFPELEKRIRHYHIASYLGITPTQLSRVRKKKSLHRQM